VERIDCIIDSWVPTASTTECAPTGTITAQATALTFDSVRIDWTALSEVNGYRVERSLTEFDDWQTVALVNTDALTFTEDHLDSGMLYMYRVVGYNIGGSVASNPSNAKTFYRLVAPIIMR
jgi:hypothetical protein